LSRLRKRRKHCTASPVQYRWQGWTLTAEQRQRLLDALETASEVEIDLAHVTEIDTAGIQVMVAAKREAAVRNKPLRFTGHSPEVVDILDLCDLAVHLGDPMLIQSRTQ
jgi:anti-anti-sigma regulatory factor